MQEPLWKPTTSVIHITGAKGGMDEVRIHRGTKWGNPYTHLKRLTMAKMIVPTRDHAVAYYVRDLKNRPDLTSVIQDELRGKKLVCYCHPLLCHGHGLMFLAEAPDPVTDDLIDLIYEKIVNASKEIISLYGGM